MSSATLTSKGQITIPASVRQRLGLKAGDRVEFMPEGQDRFVIVPAALPASALKGLVGKPERPVSIDNMNEAIAEMGARRR